jgi:hypothetical protein
LARGLLDRKANINQQDDEEFDALRFASMCGHVPVLVLLISRGADVNAGSDTGFSLSLRNHTGLTALAYAALHDKLPACLYLISQRADLYDSDGESVLERYGDGLNLTPAVLEQRRAVLQHAYDEGPHPDARWTRRWPFVMVLVCYGFQPTAARRAVLLALNPPLPTNVKIPPLPNRTRAQRRALLNMKVFGHEGIWRIIASYI